MSVRSTGHSTAHSTAHSTWGEVRRRLSADWTQPVRRSEDVVLQERARQLAQKPIEHATRSEDLLRTRIGDAIVLWPVASVRSVEPLPRWVRLPHTPAHLLGLSRVNGALAPVFDVGPLITGRTTELGAEARLVTITGAAADLSIVVEAVIDTYDESSASSPAPEDAPPFVRGVSPAGELSLDPDALLADRRLMVDHGDEL